MAAAFSGDPKTLWRTEGGADRRMELLEDFWFRDRASRQWDAAKGAVVDGASIPRPLWALVGSPYTGDYRRASIVHDIACVAATDAGERKRADRMFYEACRAGGCSRADAILLYVGVRIGAWYGQQTLEAAQPAGPKLSRDPVDRQMEEDFRSVAERVLRRTEADDAEAVEATTDEAAAAVAAMRLATGGATPLAAALAP